MVNNRGLLRQRFQQKPRPVVPDPNEVARVAYQLYEQRGRSDGNDLGDWLRAEQILRQQGRDQ